MSRRCLEPSCVRKHAHADLLLVVLMSLSQRPTSARRRTTTLMMTVRAADALLLLYAVKVVSNDSVSKKLRTPPPGSVSLLPLRLAIVEARPGRLMPPPIRRPSPAAKNGNVVGSKEVGRWRPLRPPGVTGSASRRW